MQTWRLPIITVVLVVLLGAFTLPVRAQDPTAAIDRLSNERLGRVMVMLRMGKLLDAVARESKDANLEVSALILQAETASGAQRDELLLRAAALMKQEAEAIEGRLDTLEDEDPDAWERAMGEYFGLRLRYIETKYLTRSEPYLVRFNQLRAGPRDPQALAGVTRGADVDIASLQRDLDRAIEDYRTDLMMLVSLVPTLQKYDRQLKYKGAFVYYAAALGMPRSLSASPDSGEGVVTGEAAASKDDAEENPQRRSMLSRAISSIAWFADPPERAYAGWEAYARLLKGRCHRELGEFSEAERLLQATAAQTKVPAVTFDALFELARNKAEWGAALLTESQGKSVAEGNLKFSAAVTAIDSAVQAVQAKSKLEADVRRLLLESYVYDLWSASLEELGKTAEAVQKDRQAQNAFVDFLEKYPEDDVRLGLYELMAPRFADVTDYSTLNPVIVLVLGMGRYQEAKDAGDVERLSDVQAMFQAILDSDDPAAAQIIPDALWYSGLTYNQLRRILDAVKAFRTLAMEHTDHRLAYPAAQSAVSMLYQDIQARLERGEAVPRTTRMELVESLELIVSEWPEKPEAVKRNFDLALQARILADDVNTEAEAKQWRDKAIACFQRVPTDHALYPWAKGLGLGLEAERLLNSDDPQPQKAQAEELYRKMMAYSETIRGQLPADAAPDADVRNQAVAGVRDEFLAQRIRYEIMGAEPQAVAQIKALATRWPKWPSIQPVLRESQEYLINKLVQRGDVAGAVEELRSFESEYGQDEAEELMAVVIKGLGGQIQEMLAEGGQSPELEQYRAAYLDFAQKYYDQRKVAASQDEKYRITMLLADALIQSGDRSNAERALGLFKELQQIEQARRDRQKKQIEEYFAQRQRKVRQAGDVVSAIALLHKDWLEALDKYQADEWANRSSAGAIIRHAWDRLQAAQAGESESITPQEAAERLRDAIARGYEALQSRAESTLSRNAMIVLGLANSYRQMGDYGQAVRLYREVIGGLSPELNTNMYGEAQLGYVQSVYEANKDNAEALKKLDTYIEQARERSPNFWNRERFLPLFNRLSEQIRRQVANLGG